MERQFDGFKKTGTDSEIEDRIETHCSQFNIGPLDAVKLFPVLARRQWLKRFLAHTELFQKTVNVPGDIAELGVFRGLGLMTWANLLESYCIGDRTKMVYGFDNWKGFTELSPEDGMEAILTRTITRLSSIYTKSSRMSVPLSWFDSVWSWGSEPHLSTQNKVKLSSKSALNVSVSTRSGDVNAPDSRVRR